MTMKIGNTSTFLKEQKYQKEKGQSYQFGRLKEKDTLMEES